MAELHGEAEGDGGGGLEDSAPESTQAVVTPAVTILGEAGAHARPDEMVMNDDFAAPSPILICVDRPSADCDADSSIEMARRVSTLVGLFSQSKDGQHLYSPTNLEEDINIDRVESQALQISLTQLEKERKDQDAGAEQNATDLNVTIQMNPNTFLNILNSMFSIDTDPNPSQKSFSTRKIINPSPLLTKSRILPYKPRHFPISLKARRSTPSSSSLALTSTQTKSLLFPTTSSTSLGSSQSILAVIPTQTKIPIIPETNTLDTSMQESDPTPTSPKPIPVSTHPKNTMAEIL